MLNDAIGFSEIYIVCGRTDLRYGIDSLAGVLRSLGIENPATAGTLYLFCGRRSDRIKGLVWEGDGFLLLYKKLARFLDDGEIPIDNNVAEQSIRSFCIGKKNWVMCDTINGAKSSAIIYSLVETAKANKLRLYEYFNYLLTEIPEHMDDKNNDFFEKLLPWSDELPAECRK